MKSSPKCTLAIAFSSNKVYFRFSKKTGSVQTASLLVQNFKLQFQECLHFDEVNPVYMSVCLYTLRSIGL